MHASSHGFAPQTSGLTFISGAVDVGELKKDRTWLHGVHSTCFSKGFMKLPYAGIYFLFYSGMVGIKF